jgi:thioredoxin-like negative regulator of GroEL
MNILKFTSNNCQPCKIVAKNLEGIDLKGLTFTEIDIDSDSASTTKWNVRNVPTLIIVDGDTEVARSTGSKTKQQLQDWITNNA